MSRKSDNFNMLLGFGSIWTASAFTAHRASDYGSEGREFESSAARHTNKGLST